MAFAERAIQSPRYSSCAERQSRRSPKLVALSDVEPVLGDGTVADAARIMGLSKSVFEKKLPGLRSRRLPFPAPDETTGLFDLDAIVQWRKRRHPHLYYLTSTDEGEDARCIDVRGRLDEVLGARKAR